jgi:hypothetical protein
VATAPRSVEIAGPLHDLEFPPICANCGNATSESLEVAKAFGRLDESAEQRTDTYAIVRVKVPFCPPCTAQHQIEVRQITPLQRFFLSLRSGIIIAGLGAGCVALFLAYQWARRSSVNSADLMLLGLAAFFGLISWGIILYAYRASEHLAIPPPTSVTSAFHFTDDHAGPLAREHRTVTLRNPTFADAFLARNATRVWNPNEPANQKAAKARNLLLHVLIAAFLLWLAWFILHLLR